MRLIERFAKARNRREHYFGWFVFFFKQKTAYEMDGRLEFRRVLFRSSASRRRPCRSCHLRRQPSRRRQLRQGRRRLADRRVQARPGHRPRERPDGAPAAVRGRGEEIGRASCRERVESWGGGG